jgi:hypothetical protein
MAYTLNPKTGKVIKTSSTTRTQASRDYQRSASKAANSNRLTSGLRNSIKKKKKSFIDLWNTGTDSSIGYKPYEDEELEKGNLYSKPAFTPVKSVDLAKLAYTKGKDAVKNLGISSQGYKRPELKKKQTTGTPFVNERGETEYYEDGKRKIYMPEEEPWMAGGKINQRYVADSMEQIYSIPGLDPYMEARLIANYQNKVEGLNVDPNLFPSSAEEASRRMELEAWRAKSDLETQYEAAKAEAKARADANKAAATAQFYPGREGVTSMSNIAAIDTMKGTMGGELSALGQQFDSRKRALDEAIKQQQMDFSVSRGDYIRELQADIAASEAQQQENTMGYLTMLSDSGALAGADPEMLNYLSQGLPGAPPGFINMLANSATKEAMAADRKAQFDIQSQVIDMFKGLSAEGIEMTNSMLMEYADSSGLPLEALMKFNENAQRINDDKNLDSTEKQMELAKLGYELDDISRGITTEAARKVDYLTKLYRDGAPQEVISAFKDAAGIKNYDDPMLQMQLQEQYLKNQTASIALQYLPEEKALSLASGSLDYAISEIDALMKGEDWKNYPMEKQLGLEKLKVDLQALAQEKKEKFGQGVYVSTNPKASVKAQVTPDGIKVDVKTGEVGGQCGKFVNDYLGTRIVSDSYESKLNLTDPSISTPEAGMVFVQPAIGSSAKYGHIGIVESVYTDGSGNLRMKVVDSNYGMDEKIRRRDILASNAAGFFIPPSSDRTAIGKVGTPLEQINQLADIMPDIHAAWVPRAFNMGFENGEKALERSKEFMGYLEQDNGKAARSVAQEAIIGSASDKDKQNLKDLTRNIEDYEKMVGKLIEFDQKGVVTGLGTSLEIETLLAAGQEVPKELLEFDAMSGKSFASYLKQISGVAVSEQEAARIKELFGSLEKHNTTNKALMKVLLDSAEADLDLSVDIMTNGLFDSASTMWSSLNDIENLRLSDLKMDSYGGYKPGDLSTYYADTPGTYSNYVQSTYEDFNPVYYDAF